jgi:hypothetical protein
VAPNERVEQRSGISADIWVDEEVEGHLGGVDGGPALELGALEELVLHAGADDDVPPDAQARDVYPLAYNRDPGVHDVGALEVRVLSSPVPMTAPRPTVTSLSRIARSMMAPRPDQTAVLDDGIPHLRSFFDDDPGDMTDLLTAPSTWALGETRPVCATATGAEARRRLDRARRAQSQIGVVEGDGRARASRSM